MHRGRDSELCSLSEPKSRVSCSTSLQQMDSFSVFITEQCPHVHLRGSGVRIIHFPAWPFMLTSLYFPFDYRARILLLIEYASMTYRQEMGQVRTDTATLEGSDTLSITYALVESSFQNTKSVFKTINQFSKHKFSFQNNKSVFKAQIQFSKHKSPLKCTKSVFKS